MENRLTGIGRLTLPLIAKYLSVAFLCGIGWQGERDNCNYSGSLELAAAHIDKLFTNQRTDVLVACQDIANFIFLTCINCLLIQR